MMASDKIGFNIDGEDVEFEITEWSGTVVTVRNVAVWVAEKSGIMRLWLPAGHPELN